MATTTATVLIGHAHQNDSGINPTHIIRFTENDRPALILSSIDGKSDPIVIIPTIENTINDIYLMVAVFILEKVKTSKEIHNAQRLSLYDLLENNERQALYVQTFEAFQDTKLKLVFNILDNSHLLSQLEIIKEHPTDFEITLPAMKREFDAWSNKIITKGI